MREPNVQLIHEKFRGRISKKWSFQETRSVERLTHGYHRYPAKFVPQLVSKLIEKYTVSDSIIADVFAGCGTTLVEGKIHGRRSIGVDINPVAEMITRVKTNAINPIIIKDAFDNLTAKIDNYKEDAKYYVKSHARIEYWFDEINRNKISFLYSLILKVKDKPSADFFLCALSNILKNCSRWLQDSTKPQVDPSKKPSEVFSSFKLQVKRMMKKNNEFYDALSEKGLAKTSCKIKLADARRTGIRGNTISAIITSPPYVTSYEYADIHQLTGYWYNYISDIATFRRKFIGTFYSLNRNLRVSSPTAASIIAELEKKEIKMAREVANYFRDMTDVAKEMMRILSPDGVVCLVIGNTELRQVKIKSAEAFAEMLFAVGFEIEEVIKRSIPHKLIPTIRDKNTGRFTTLDSQNSKKAYPNEYIIIARKPNVNN